MSPEPVEQGSDLREDMGYDAPFASFTWERWQEMQVRTFLGFTRFQRAIEQRQPQQALTVAIEMQGIGLAMQKEVGRWIEGGKPEAGEP